MSSSLEGGYYFFYPIRTTERTGRGEVNKLDKLLVDLGSSSAENSKQEYQTKDWVRIITLRIKGQKRVFSPF